MSSRVSPQERKQQIIAAATAVFARKGFEGATMDDIVAESGLSKGGLYWHFDSKDAIITAILQQFFDQELADFDQIIAQGGTAAARLQQIASHMAGEIEEMGNLLPLTLDFYALAGRDEAVRQAMQGYYIMAKEGLERLFREGVESGELIELDAANAAITLIAIFEGLIVLWIIYPEEIDLQARAQSALQLFLRGLQNER